MKVTRRANSAKALKEILKDEIGLELRGGEMKIRGGVLVVRTNPAVKMEILLRREKILSLLNRALGPGVVNSIQ